MEGKEYKDRACCEIGGTVPSESCPAEKLETPGAIVGFVSGFVILLCSLCGCCYCCNKMRSVRTEKANSEMHRQSQQNNAVTNIIPAAAALPVSHIQTTTASGRYPMVEPEFNLGTAYNGVSMVMPPNAAAALPVSHIQSNHGHASGRYPMVEPEHNLGTTAYNGLSIMPPSAPPVNPVYDRKR